MGSVIKTFCYYKTPFWKEKGKSTELFFEYRDRIFRTNVIVFNKNVFLRLLWVHCNRRWCSHSWIYIGWYEAWRKSPSVNGVGTDEISHDSNLHVYIFLIHLLIIYLWFLSLVDLFLQIRQNVLFLWHRKRKKRVYVVCMLKSSNQTKRYM